MAEITWEEPEGSGQLRSMEFDATVRDSHEASATVTEHPVEEGANISDHVRKDLDRLTLEVIVSNTPIRPPKTQTGGVVGSTQGLDITDPNSGVTLATASVLQFDGELDRVRTVYEELLRLMNTGTILSVFTSLREYENMLLRRVAPVREAASGNALIAPVEFTEVVIVESEVVTAPVAEETRGNPGANNGNDNTTETDESTSESGGSFLTQLIDLATS